MTQEQLDKITENIRDARVNLSVFFDIADSFDNLHMGPLAGDMRKASSLINKCLDEIKDAVAESITSETKRAREITEGTVKLVLGSILPDEKKD